MTDRHLDSHNESRKFKISTTGYWDGEVHAYHTADPGLAEWIAETLDPNEQVYDLGCGVGSYLAILSKHHFPFLLGYDGTCPDVRDFGAIIPHDLTTPLHVAPGNVISLEVGEHVPPQYEAALVENIANACKDTLLLSWAVPGQCGDGHVNLKTNEEVIALFEPKGLQHQPALSAKGRAAVTSLDWFRNTLMVFKRVR